MASLSGTGPCTMLCAQGRKNCAAGCCACDSNTNLPLDTIGHPVAPGGGTPGPGPGIVTPPVAAPSTCGSVTIDGKTRYFSSNASVVTGIEAVATLAFAPVFGTFMLFVTLLFAWISFKTDGALHWITLIISLISLWTTGKTAYKRYKAKKFLDENLKDTCDAPVAKPA